MPFLELEAEVRSAAERACTVVDGLGLPSELLYEPLMGGITNRNFRVIAADRDVVLRIHGKDTDLLGIDRRLEHAAALQAADLGIGPGVAGLVEPELYLVTEFVVAETADLLNPATFVATVELLRRWHSSSPIPGGFDTFGLAKTYARRASERGVSLPLGAEQAIEISDEVAAVFATFDDPAVPCHNDLLGANFLSSTDDPGRVWLIDWEYAGMNTRWFDLGNFSINNGFDSDADDALLEAYFGTVSPSMRARLTLARVMSDVRESMWGVVQQGISTLDFDYSAYAQQHFDRMIMNTTSPAFTAALQNAGA